MPDPLEQFLTDYVGAISGLVDEIEPQVYDVLLPDGDKPLRVAFDPEALPEHPSAQLLTFGSALLDELLANAQARGRTAVAFLDDVQVSPYGLDQRLQRDLVLPDGVALQTVDVRPLYVTHSLFWFEITYLGDEKEQALLPVAIDRYYDRQVRYLDSLLDGDRLSETRRWAFPDTKASPVDRAYLSGRDALVRTVRAEAHSRQQQLQAGFAQQTERMRQYYADRRAEIAERAAGDPTSAEDADSLRLRLEALDREEALRLDELQRKALLQVELRLTNALHVKIPRLFVSARLASAGGIPAASRAAILQLTWNPLPEKTDALVCPHCQHPTYELRFGRRGDLRCPNCVASD